jgi:predicted PurR-regulated permease PerM
MEDKKQVIIDISVKTVLKIVLVFLILGFLYLIKNVVAIVVIAFIFSSIMIPAVDYLKKRKIPRLVSVILIYLIFLSFITLAIYLIVPIVTSQIGNLANRIGEVFATVSNWLNRFDLQRKDLATYIQKGLEVLSGQISYLTENIYNFTVKIVGGIITTVMILVLAFYLTIEKNASKRLVRLFLPQDKQKHVVNIIYKAQRKMGLWLGGQIIMSFFVFIISFIIFLILGLDNAFTLALIMGILEIIPYFGPLFGGAVAALVGFSQSFWLGIIVIIAIILIQQVENHVLEPNVMGKVTGLSPVVIILAILIGVELFGFIGIIIAIPIAVGISVILQESFSVNEKGFIYRRKVHPIKRR